MQYYILFLMSQEGYSTQKIIWSTRFMFSIVRVTKLLAQITNNVTEDTKEFIRATLYNGNKK